MDVENAASYAERLIAQNHLPLRQRMPLLVEVRARQNDPDNRDPRVQAHLQGVVIGLTRHHEDDPLLVGIHTSAAMKLQTFYNDNRDTPGLVGIVGNVFTRHADPGLIATASTCEPGLDPAISDVLVFKLAENATDMAKNVTHLLQQNGPQPIIHRNC